MVAELVKEISVRKTADESVSSSTTLQDDDVLLFAVGANEVWVADLYLYLSATNLSLADFKMAFTVPSGSTMNLWWANHDNDEEARVSGAITQTTVSGTGIAVIIGSGATKSLVHVMFYVAVGTTAGNCQLQWAQNTSDAGATTVKDGSFLIARREAVR